MSSIDTVIPKKKWEFDKNVSECFEDMLKRSIPQYDVMRKSVYDLACQYRKRSTDILDMGCSRGEAISDLIDKYGAYNRFIGIDTSNYMVELAKQRFKHLIEQKIVQIENMDLREDFPPVNASVILSILTIQFTPIEYRQNFIQNVYNHLIDGGAFIFVEKVLGSTNDINKTMVNNYYEMKSNNGYSYEDIDRKKSSLEGVLVPVTAKWNEELVKMSGFRQVDCFWRWMNFSGWIAIK